MHSKNSKENIHFFVLQRFSQIMRYLSLISNSLFRGYYITKMSYQKVGRAPGLDFFFYLMAVNTVGFFTGFLSCPGSPARSLPPADEVW